MGTPDDAAAVLGHLALPCADAIADVYKDAIAPAPWNASHRGDIVHCAYDRLISAQEMDAYDAAIGFSPLAAQTAVHKLRVSYWTERALGIPVLTSAELMVPAVRVAAPAPLLSIGHGTLGAATQCAPSLEPSKLNDQQQTYQLASQGWVVLAPDYPGLGTNGTTAWQYSPEEGHSLLDATRAARKLTKPGFLSTHNVVLGHSQGGHAAISAQAYASTYGTAGTLDAVIAYAPSFFTAGAYAAVMTNFAANLGAVNSFTLLTTTLYLRGHLAAIEGESHRNDAIRPEKIGALETLLASGCLDVVADPVTGLPSIGVNKGSDLFTAEYVTEVGNCGAFGSCASPLAMTWKARFVTDRPKVDPLVPLVLWAGGKDDTVPPALAQCGIDRISAETTNFAACGDANAGHSDIISLSSGWVRQYLAAVTLGYGYPAACTSYASISGGAKCQSPPPNNATDPTLPLTRLTRHASSVVSRRRSGRRCRHRFVGARRRAPRSRARVAPDAARPRGRGDDRGPRQLSNARGGRRRGADERAVASCTRPGPSPLA